MSTSQPLPEPSGDDARRDTGSGPALGPAEPPLPRWLTDVPSPEDLVGTDAELPEAARVLEVLARLEEEGPEALSDLPAQEVLGVMASVQRSIARAQQLQADLAAAVAVHPHLRIPGALPADATEGAAGEVSVVLGASMRQARALVRKGQRLNDWLWPVAQQGRAGMLDAARTAVFVEELEGALPAATLAVLDRVLPAAPGRPPSALRSLIRRVLATVDPHGEAERVEAALGARHVRSLRPMGSGMAVFSALLPAAAAAGLEHACEAAAKAAKAAGDPRTLGQLRADALTGMGQEALLTGTIGVAAGAEADGGRRPSAGTDEVFRFDPRAARVRISMPSAAPADELAPADAVAVDFALDVAGDTETNGPGTPPAPATVRLPRAGAYVPELAGFGPLVPRQARALLDRRWIAAQAPPDPDEPEPEEVEPGYSPSTKLREYVIRRDGHCQAPGCTVPAERGDLHHVIPWPQGPTAAWNLRAVCRAHHNLLTHYGHAMDVLEHDVFGYRTVRWRTPAGTTRYLLPGGQSVGEPGYQGYIRLLEPPPVPPWEPEPEPVPPVTPFAPAA